MQQRLLLLCLLSLAACDPASHVGMDAMDVSDATADRADATDQAMVPDAPPAPHVSVMMDFTRSAGFFTAPFPSEDRRTAPNRIDIHDFPNPRQIGMVVQIVSLLQSDARGFGTTSEIAFQLTARPDVTHLPDIHHSIMPDSPVFLMSVDSGAVDYQHRYPLIASYDVSGGPYGAPNLLTLLPVQGVPLRPNTLYAAVVLRSLNDASGRPLDVTASMSQLTGGTMPAGMSATAFTSYQTALTALRASSIDVSQIAGLAVFKTDSPTDSFAAVAQDVLSRPPPQIDAPFTFSERFDNYCVYHTTISMPDYQSGTPPFSDPSMGGRWIFDASGHPIVQRHEQANFFVTVPRVAMPTAGYPTVVFVNAGAGGGARDESMVDRGQQAVNGGPPIVPGSGPAMYFANVGFAGAAVDAPFGGLRNPMNLDEDFTIINVQNVQALRDNVREQGIDQILFAHILDNITVNIDSTDCPGVGAPTIHFDTGTMALMGHSLGAWFAPLALAYEPRFRAGILAGYGASWIENVIWKISPTPVLPALRLLLSDNALNEHDPVLSLLQWAGEPADPAVYARYITTEPVIGPPRHIYVIEGIVDTYLMPPIFNAGALALGLDLGGPSFDTNEPRLSAFTPLASWLDLVNAHSIALPASNNLTSTTGTPFTGVMVQATQDAVEDGHEVVFQIDSPKHQYQCFLSGFAHGTPSVPSAGALTDSCDH